MRSLVPGARGNNANSARDRPGSEKLDVSHVTFLSASDTSVDIAFSCCITSNTCEKERERERAEERVGG